MKNYKPIKNIIRNENVLRVLSGAKLPGEGSLLVEVLGIKEEESIFNIYVTYKNPSFTEDEPIYLAEVIKKKDKIGINNWYVNF